MKKLIIIVMTVIYALQVMALFLLSTTMAIL